MFQWLASGEVQALAQFSFSQKEEPLVPMDSEEIG